MLKLNASYSKKIPVEGQDYSSQSYHASVELELSDSLKPEELRQRIHETFQLVRQSVETELDGKSAVESAPAAKPDGKGTRNTEKASNRQIKFAMDLAVRNGHSLSELNAMLNEQFDVEDLYALNRKQASQLIDELSKEKQKKAA